MQITSRIFPGRLHKDNKGALDWGIQNLIAYGCQSFVVIVDPVSFNVVQTLDEHKAHVVCVKWSTESVNSSEFKLQLASGDKQGNIIIWSVHDAEVCETLQGFGSVTCMEWIHIPKAMAVMSATSTGTNDSNSNFNAHNSQHTNFLLVVYAYPSGSSSTSGSASNIANSGNFGAPSSISKISEKDKDKDNNMLSSFCVILWNVQNGSKIWKYDATQFISLISTPLPTNLTASGISAVSPMDFCINRLQINPFDRSEVFVATVSGHLFSLAISQATSSDSTNVSVSTAFRHFIARQASSNDLMDTILSPHIRNTVYFCFQREVVIVDLQSNNVLSSINLDRTKPSFVKCFLSRDCPHVLIAVHEDGALGCWQKFEEVDVSNAHQYQLQLIAENARISKQNRKKGVAVCSVSTPPFVPLSDNVAIPVATLSTDGQLSLWNYYEQNKRDKLKVNVAETSTDMAFDVPEEETQDVIADNEVSQNLQITKSSTEVDLGFRLSSVRYCVSAPISSLAAFNVNITEGNLTNQRFLVALGTYHGTLQILDMATLEVVNEIAIWNQALRGIKWLDQSTTILFSCDQVSKNEYKNQIAIVDLNLRKFKEIRKLGGNGLEDSFIRAVRVSPSMNFLIVLLKDKPFELWDLKSSTLLRTVKPFSQIAALEWSPVMQNLETTSTVVREEFVFSLPDGSLKFYCVESPAQSTFSSPTVQTQDGALDTLDPRDGNSAAISPSNIAIKPIESVVELGSGIISTIAWKGDFLVSGDTTGTLTCYNFKTKKSNVFSTNKGLVRRIRFNPVDTNYQILVLFNEGDFGVWDLDHNIRVSISTYFRSKDLKAIDCDWMVANSVAPLIAIPVAAMSDGSIRVIDKTLSISNSSIPSRQAFLSSLPAKKSRFFLDSDHAPLAIATPYILTGLKSIQLKVLLQHYKRLTNNIEYTNFREFPSLESSVMGKFNNAASSLENFLLTARWFGDAQDDNFWTVATWAFAKLGNNQTLPSLQNEEPTTIEKPVQNSSVPKIQRKNLFHNHEKTKELPLFFDPLMDGQDMAFIEQARLQSYRRDASAKSATQLQLQSQHRIQTTYYNILLGEKDSAIATLLDTPLADSNWYANYLKAAIVAASVSQESFQSTMKVIGTNMIQNGHIDEGVQLLCLIGKTFDACNYLQSCGRWYDAAKLAKISLPTQQCDIIMKQWASHLTLSNQKMGAILIMLALGEFRAVIDLLHQSDQIQLAALFICVCEEREQAICSPEPDMKATGNMVIVPLQQLKESIFLEYGFFLQKIGLHGIAEYYWQKAGPAGLATIEAMRAPTLD